MSSLGNEERDVINRLQQLTERRSQLVTSLNDAQASYEEVTHQITHLQNELTNPGRILSDEEVTELKSQFAQIDQKRQTIHRQYEELHLEQIRSDNRVNLIRKELVCFIIVFHSSLIWRIIRQV